MLDLNKLPAWLGLKSQYSALFTLWWDGNVYIIIISIITITITTYYYY